MNKGFAAILERLTLGAVALCFLASGLGQLFGKWYPFELLLNFPLQYATVALGATLLLLSLNRRMAALITGLFALLQLFFLVPFYLPSSAPGEAVNSTKIMYANVFRANTRFDAVLALFEAENPDILVIAELTHPWATRMEALAKNYPHQILMPLDNAFGIGVYSRYPLTQKLSLLTEQSSPSIVAEATVAGGKFSILATHVVPPVRAQLFRLRNQQLGGIAAESHQQSGHRVIMGDLNTTPWSPYFERLLLNSGLRDARRGHGLASTWPATFTPWGIPIDHLLISPGIGVVALHAAEIPGSDHRAVIASVTLTH